MKAVILAGGLGSRLSEETSLRPKPMVEIGGKPILWHIMKMYSSHGIHEFIICLGYRGYVIKEYFANYFLHTCDVTFDMTTNGMQVHQSTAEPWKVTLIDTGEHTMTGGRLARVFPFIGDEVFCMTYGDAVSDLDIEALVRFHDEKGGIATVTAIQPPGRFGSLEFDDDDRVRGFQEKPEGEGGWINGGFFVLSPRVRDYLSGDDTIWENEPLQRLADEGELASYRHSGYWQAMDTLRDKHQLEDRWVSGDAPWKRWT